MHIITRRGEEKIREPAGIYIKDVIVLRAEIEDKGAKGRPLQEYRQLDRMTIEFKDNVHCTVERGDERLWVICYKAPKIKLPEIEFQKIEREPIKSTLRTNL